ncbi:T-box transcription factor TBX20-like isoform X2 [Tachypleus tridentatus]|uniref:T-box transcription factor TBX20-like isoform X2 n=1 Tax=Tachypleus tridentatus TaxID=6853 RepID=UPI003FD32E8D
MTLKNYAEYSTVQLSSRAKAFSIDALLHDQSTNFSRINKNSATEGKCAQNTTLEKPLETSSEKDLIVEEIGFRQFPQFCIKPENPFTDSTCRKYGTGVLTTVGSTLDTHITVELCRQDLWKKFHLLGNEMIITKAGRRLFPALKVKISGLHPDGQYSVWIDIVPVDSNRYRYMYSNSRWMVAGKGNQLLERTRYIHPDSPANGHQWMAQTVSFEKMKLTNNKHPVLRGQVVLHSMHKYQPTICIERVDNIGSSKAVEAETAEAKSFVFPETSFFTVTAYQNQQITKLKIASNPFAKGFREASKYRDSDPHILTQCSMKDHDATSVTFTPRTSFCVSMSLWSEVVLVSWSDTDI